jgi:aldehyde:ferredoxin oxidoreductase
MLGGYQGKMLFVNLTDKTMTEEAVKDKMARKYLGGYGFGARILYERMPKGADPLGPDNMLGFLTGPANGTKALFGGRYTIVHKSPVTGGWNDANSGGHFAPELKKSGYDAVFINGISEGPVYLWIHDGQAELKDASALWGLDCKETEAAIRKELGDDKISVSAIGPAGEKIALMACPINDGHRAPGRGGGGAVMGSKKLKAVAVRGTLDVPVADPDMVKQVNKKITLAMKGNPLMEGFGVYGTGVGTGASALNGDSPVKNWGGVGIRDIGEEKANLVAAPTFDAKYKTKQYHCANCPLGCGAEYKVDDGRWPLGDTERPEYETAAAFGCLLLNAELDAVFKCNEICNRAGLDTISTGMTVAWAMECFEEGILTLEDLDGIALNWGNGEAIVAITQKIAKGEGVGAILMNGSRAAAEHFGKGHDFLQTAMGIELPMHDPRLAPGFGRTYQYDPTPGRHVKGGLGMAQMMGAPIGPKYDYRTTGYLDVKLTAGTEVTNSGGFCMFGGMAAMEGELNQLIGAITGEAFLPQTADEVGMRIFIMRHMFNVREGITPKTMNLPDRAGGHPPLEEGPLAGVEVDNQRLGQNFFAFFGIDPETGIPSKGTLKRLGMEFLIDEYYGEE